MVCIVKTGEKVMKIWKAIIAALLAALMFTGLTACEKEGPAEKAGKAIDDAASDVAKEANEAMETVEKKIED
jgi:predicted small lipoprotein YifL